MLEAFFCLNPYVIRICDINCQKKLSFIPTFFGEIRTNKQVFWQSGKDSDKNSDKKSDICFCLTWRSEKGVCMRPYYLTTNKYGYYLVSFTNKESGKRTPYKSTHTKDYGEAVSIAMQWYTDGTPSENVIRANRQKASECKINIDNLLLRMTEIEARTLYDRIALQFGFGVPAVTAPTPVTIVEPAKTVTSVVVSAPVEEPAPKKKVVVVHKKNALADSGLLPEDVAQKVYEPLNPDCTIKLCEFLRNFWTPEKSEYIKNKRAHKKPCGDYHCKEMRGMVDRYWLPFFGEEFTVGELSEQYLEDFLQELANFRHLKGATINHARTCSATGLKWLKNKCVIRYNPMANVEAFSKSDSTLCY